MSAPRCSAWRGDRARRGGRRAAGPALAIAIAIAAPSARAYEPATTQAGLVQEAALVSRLHAVLVERFGRPLGLFELLAAGQAPSLAADQAPYLALLDPAQGYRPDPGQPQTALAWLAAGAALAETPPERGRNHYFDPSTGRGLDDRLGPSGAWHAFLLALDGAAGLRQIATGTAFNQTGRSSRAWWQAADNPLGLPVLLAALERAVAGAEPAVREAALVDALLALGGMAAVLVDAGEPAHVRNDFRGAANEPGPVGSWDRRSRYERLVAERFGRTGLPRPARPVERPALDAFLSDPDGQGLADRTQRRFFSDGTVPGAIPLDPAMTEREVAALARQQLRYARPAVGRLHLRRAGTQYLVEDGRRVLAYRRLPDRVTFFLDEAVYLDTARAVLPEIGAYVAGLVNHLLRAELRLSREGERITVTLTGARGAVTGGTLALYWEDAAGTRHTLASPAPAPDLAPGPEAAALSVQRAVVVPPGARRLCALLRGQDAAGGLLASGQLRLTD